MMRYREAGNAFVQQGMFDSAVVHYKQGLHRSQFLNSRYWMARYGLWTAGVYTAATLFDSAEHYYAWSRPLIESLRNDSLTAQYHQNLGTLCMYQNRLEPAAEHLIRSISIMERMGDLAPSSILMSAYTNISGIFNSTGQSAKARVYDEKALAQKNTIARPEEIGSIFFNAHVTCMQLDDLVTAKQYLDSAVRYESLYPNPRVRMNILGGLGTYFDRVSGTDSAIHYTELAVETGRKHRDFYFLTEQAINAANLHLRQNRVERAARLLNEALPHAEAFRDFRMMSEAYEGLKRISEQRGDYRKALSLDELSDRYRDSVSTAETANRILSLEARYESERKEKELSALRLSITEKQLDAVRRNRMMTTGGLAAIGLVITLGLLYRNSKQKRIISEKDSKLKADRIAFLESQQQVVSLQSMINGQEMERTRIAKDLHDGLGGLFSTLKMYFSTLLHDRQELEAEPLMKKSGELIQMASEEVRRIAHNMMPEVLLKIGLVQGVRELCAAISAGRLLQVSFQAYGMDRRLDGPTEVMLYRILQELLNNIMKHAQATEAIVQFNRNGQALNITVEDNGKGFKPGAREGYRHSGLDSVYSRVQSLKGQMTIESRQQMGTTVMMEFRIAEDPVT